TMQRSLLLTLDDLLVRQEASFRDLFLSRLTYVDAELAGLYGLPQTDGNALVPTEWPPEGDRLGLMGHAAILAVTSHSDSTSPTVRGRFIRERLLCQGVPSPPPDIPALPGTAAGGPPQTMRQQLEQHRANPACAGCHVMMDPMGLPLEHYDAVGAYRDTDRGLPLDVSGELDGASFAGLPGLAQALAASDRALDCIPIKLFAYATGRLPASADTQALAALRRDFRTGEGRLRALIMALVTSPLFLGASL
ncbi:MAG TPA: DUF1588 domain-containing protein, partial [Myxococcota bacterium]|nr:DUF1588 domain-containing protein [Myxococcota bacterium]